jgi:hypothetical protein
MCVNVYYVVCVVGKEISSFIFFRRAIYSNVGQKFRERSSDDVEVKVELHHHHNAKVYLDELMLHNTHTHLLFFNSYLRTERANFLFVCEKKGVVYVT